MLEDIEIVAHKKWLAWALIAAVTLHLFVLYYQLNYGGLTGLIPWDDCAIILRGLQNLDKLAQSDSLWQMAAAILHVRDDGWFIIHAPVSDIQTFFGLLVSGGAVWGPYALNVLLLCIAIYAVSRTAAAEDPIVFFAATVFFLTLPITFKALAELKSDWQGGLLLAGTLFLLFDAADENNNKNRIFGAALLGLVLITKMTAFYLPVFALGLFIAFEVYRSLKQALAAPGAIPFASALWRRAFVDLSANLKGTLFCAALILAPYLIFFAYSHGWLLDYIRAALGPLFFDGFTKVERLLFYSPLPGKATTWAWGGLHLMFLAFLVAGLTAALLKRAWHHVLVSLAIPLAATVFLLPLVMANTSNISFGAHFFGVVMGGTLIAMRIFVINARPWARYAVPVVVVALALPRTLPLSAPNDLAGEPLTRAQVGHYQSIYDDMARRIADRNSRSSPRVVLTFEYFVAPHPNLSINYYRQTGAFLSIERIDDFTNPRAISLLWDADFAVTIAPASDEQRVPNVSTSFPASVEPATSDWRVRESGRFVLVATYPVDGGEIRLYQAARQ